jgi:hypothetical protein
MKYADIERDVRAGIVAIIENEMHVGGIPERLYARDDDAADQARRVIREIAAEVRNTRGDPDA